MSAEIEPQSTLVGHAPRTVSANNPWKEIAAACIGNALEFYARDWC